LQNSLLLDAIVVKISARVRLRARILRHAIDAHTPRKSAISKQSAAKVPNGALRREAPHERQRARRGILTVVH
jgi:hypothetical protein